MKSPPCAQTFQYFEWLKLTLENSDKFAAGPQGLGYIYQPRLALLRLLNEPESTGVLIEGQDDLEFVGPSGNRSLASLKHKAIGENLTDLSSDFWKSVRIWLTRYNQSGRTACSLRFFLYTTNSVAETSFLTHFVEGASPTSKSRSELFEEAKGKSSSKLISSVEAEYTDLSEDECEDFLSRISIFDSSPRITDLTVLISDKHLRTIPREHRAAVLERLEGWWQAITIRQLAGETTNPIFGYEVSDKLSAIAEEYRFDNLPISFRGKKPEGEINPENDNRLFVQQLRILGISTSRMQSAIIDYYRAFEQRSSWARENLLVSGEIEEYEGRLVEEWQRYKDVVVEDLGDIPSEDKLVAAGKEIFKWAEFETEHLRIRERVTEPYVVRGAFHILANNRPAPRVHWHPEFLSRIEGVLEDAL